MILVLHLNKPELLLFVFADEANELSGLFNFVQGFDEFVREALDPFDVFLLDLDERVADAFLPVANDRNVRLVFNDGLSCVRLDLLKLFQLALVLLVDVVQVLTGHDTLKTLVLLLSL